MRKTLKSKWYLKWIILSISAPLVSFIGGYAYLYFLAVIFPLAQTIALSSLPKSRKSWLWMIHSFYWIAFIVYTTEFDVKFGLGAFLILLSSLIGELLLKYIIGASNKFKWTLYNSLGLLCIFFVFYLISEMSIPNDLLEMSLVIFIAGVYAVISGIGVWSSYTNKKSD